MTAALYETVPALESKRKAPLRDFGYYRMAIEDDDIRDRKVWTGVARQWYSKASNMAPTTGKIHIHGQILPANILFLQENPRV